jgi:hypothetical protein
MFHSGTGSKSQNRLAHPGGEEHSERVVLQQFVLEAFRSIDQLSPIDGLRTVILFPFGLKPRP